MSRVVLEWTNCSWSEGVGRVRSMKGNLMAHRAHYQIGPPASVKLAGVRKGAHVGQITTNLPI